MSSELATVKSYILPAEYFEQDRLVSVNEYGMQVHHGKLDDLVYVDRQGNTISQAEHDTLTDDNFYVLVRTEDVGNGVMVQTRYNGIIGTRTWFDGTVDEHTAYVTFKIMPDMSYQIIGGFNSEREALHGHRMLVSSERTYQTLLRGTVPAVRSGVL